MSVDIFPWTARSELEVNHLRISENLVNESTTEGCSQMWGRTGGKQIESGPEKVIYLIGAVVLANPLDLMVNHPLEPKGCFAVLLVVTLYYGNLQVSEILH